VAFRNSAKNLTQFLQDGQSLLRTVRNTQRMSHVSGRSKSSCEFAQSCEQAVDFFHRVVMNQPDA
jgi:hypothetical protein